MLRQGLPLARQVTGRSIGRNAIAQWPVTRPNLDLQVQYLNSLRINSVLTLLPADIRIQTWEYKHQTQYP